jgi:hypothetical protein
MRVSFHSVALAAIILPSCAPARVRKPVPVALDIALPHARDLPTVAMLHVSRRYINILLPEPVAYEGDLMVGDDLIVFDPRSRPLVVPALGDWHRVTLYVPGAGPIPCEGPEVRAARRTGALAVPWPAPAGSVDDLVAVYAEGAIDAGSTGAAVPFLLRHRDGGLHVAAAPGWTASFPGGDLPEHLRLMPGRWDSPLLDVPRLQAIRYVGEDHCELTLVRPVDGSRNEVAYLFAARADAKRGTVAWLYGRKIAPREEYPLGVVGSLTRVVDGTTAVR